MTLNLLEHRGVPLDKQLFTWRDMVQPPISPYDDDALSRCRILTLAAVEAATVRFSHVAACMDRSLQLPLAKVRRVDQHQRTLVNYLLPADLTPLEISLAHEQCGVETAAMITRHESDPALAQVFRFVLLEDMDHLYRFAALLQRLEGKDARRVLQHYTDAVPGRPTRVSHRAPEDELRSAYDTQRTTGLSKMNVRTLLACKDHTYQYYMTVGAMFADTMARQLYAEIASVEEQHLTQYTSLIDPRETMFEKWLLWEACEAYNYYCAMKQETNPRLRAIWERFLDYELGQLSFARQLFERLEGRDASEVLPSELPDPAPYKGQREFIANTRERETGLRAAGGRFIDANYERSEAAQTVAYRNQLNSGGVPSDAVIAGYVGEHPPH